jgi:hypothetical protein
MEKGEEKVPSKDGIAGSQDINNAAYNVLIVWRNKMKRRRIDELKEGKDIAKIMETEKLPDGRIRLDKQRFGTGEDAEVKIWFDPVSWQFQETQGKRIPYMVFDKNKNPF